jgi:hypothetical protein
MLGLVGRFQIFGATERVEGRFEVCNRCRCVTAIDGTYIKIRMNSCKDGQGP